MEIRPFGDKEKHLGPHFHHHQKSLNDLRKENVMKSNEEKVESEISPSNEKIKDEVVHINLKDPSENRILEYDGFPKLSQKSEVRNFTFREMTITNLKKKTFIKSSEKTLKTLLFRQKILRFVDNLKWNAGLFEISRASSHVISLINDLAYLTVKKREAHEINYLKDHSRRVSERRKKNGKEDEENYVFGLKKNNKIF